MPHKIALRLPAPSESGPEILDVGFGTSEVREGNASNEASVFERLGIRVSLPSCSWKKSLKEEAERVVVL